ncbi:hypothetical protein BDQ17DRAFT_1433272 [Cyathus striatus]|nr:hypothetical protein BDQ17DRAFT_1433272 [Cyathus striatus]
MANHPMIPLQDLAELIVDHIATAKSGSTNYADLKSCSLASRTFTPYCQKHVFSKLDLWHYDSMVAKRYELFKSLVANNPRLLTYIRILRLCLRENEEEDKFISIVENPAESAILEQLFSVEEFSLCGPGDIYGCPPAFHRYICKILGLESLKSVTFSDGVDFTWAPVYFRHMVHVQKVYLDGIFFNTEDPSQLESHICDSPIPKYSDHNLKKLQTLCIDGGSVKEVSDMLTTLHASENTSFTLSDVEVLRIDPNVMEDVIAGWNMMQRCSKSLQKLIWCCNFRVGEFPYIPVDLGIFEVLKKVVYRFGDHSELKNDLQNLQMILSTSSTYSSLEVLKITLSTTSSNWNYYTHSLENEWRQLDKFLSSKMKMFPVLRDVKIRIYYDINKDRVGKFLTYFPCLSQSNYIKLHLVLDDWDLYI